MDIIRPEAPEKAAALVATATRGGFPVVIRGTGNRVAWQPAGPEAALTLDTGGLSGKGHLRPENLSASFPAGTALSVVHAQLRAAGLWLPLEHSEAPEASLGGCLAAGFTNPLRLGYGSPRDWVLGLQIVTADGRLLTLGGDLIKNVAGYDLVKPHLGAWGRLGLIVRATLRLLPLPETEVTVTAAFDRPAEAAAATIAVMASDARPVALELVRRADGFRLFTRLAGDAARVGARAAALRAVLGSGAVHSGNDHVATWQGYATERADLARRYPWRLKLSIPAPGPAEALDLLSEAMKGLDWAVAGHAGSGVFTAYWEAEDGPATVLDRLRYQIGFRGFVVAEGGAARCLTTKEGWTSFPPRAPRSQDRLEAALLEALVPGRRFNPHLPAPEREGRP